MLFLFKLCLWNVKWVLSIDTIEWPFSLTASYNNSDNSWSQSHKQELQTIILSYNLWKINLIFFQNYLWADANPEILNNNYSILHFIQTDIYEQTHAQLM